MNDSGRADSQTADFTRLLTAARRGDSDAVGALLNQHGPYLRAIAIRELDASLQMKESPSDLTQKTFLEAHRDFAGFHGESADEFRQWLAKILQHNLADVGRTYRVAQKRTVGREFSLEDESRLAGDDPSPSTPVRRIEEDTQLQRAIQRLPANYRAAIELRHHANLEFAAVGARLGISAEAARKLWARAILRLREELKSSDGT